MIKHNNPEQEKSMRTIALSILVMVLCACSSNMPAPSVSEYVETELGGFTIVRDEGVRYAMTYTLLQPSESATSYKVAFDSMTSKDDHLTTEGTITAGTPELLVQSPVLPGVKNGRTYTVLLTLYVDGAQLTTHKDLVKFSMPSNILKQMGIKEY